jgi:hypothetical protein
MRGQLGGVGFMGPREWLSISTIVNDVVNDCQPAQGRESRHHEAADLLCGWIWQLTWNGAALAKVTMPVAVST